MEWFSTKLHEERARLRKLFDLAKVTKARNVEEGTQLQEEYKLKRDEYREHCRRAKEKAWIKKTESLDNIKDTARLQKILETNKPPELGSLIMRNGKYSANNEEAIQELMETHFPECIPMTSDSAADSHTPTRTEDIWNNDIEDTLQDEKINWAINSLAPFKSPGEDGIFPALLHKASDAIIPILAVLFKASVKLNYIPVTWRGTFVTFIPKADKATYDKAKSYRPISLMSFILKTLEKLIDRRIREKDLEIRPLSNSQHAYQQGKGTESALHYLVTEIEKNTRNDNASLVAFIDIEGAFDNTSFEVINKSAKDKKINPWITNWINAMLKSRNIKASMAGSKIKYNPTRGCPQGGCLSPLLWSLVVDPLIKKLTAEGFKVSAYADDLAIIVSGKKKFMSSLCDRLNYGLKIVEEWCSETGLSVNPDKAYVMRFSKGHLRSEPGIIKLYNKELQLVDHFKYLGVTLDKTLKWGLHIEKAVKKGMRALWATKTMLSKKWGLSPKAMLWIYNQIIIPRVTYGCITWWHRAEIKSNCAKLNSLQRTALMLVTGAMRTTPTAALEAILNITPLEIKIKVLAVKACARLKAANTWRKDSDYFDMHRGIEKVLDKLENDGESDECARTWNNNKKYATVINERNNWSYSLDISNNNWCWYTDGSIRDGKAALGIVNLAAGIEIGIRLSDHSTIMQAEILGIKECALMCLNYNIENKNIIILTDSQAAIKAIGNSFVIKSTIKTCIEQLNKLGERNRLTIAWVPGHSKVKGNERADAIANKFIDHDIVEMEVPRAAAILANEILKFEANESAKSWNGHTNCVHSKKFIKGFEEKKAKLIINCGRKNARVLTGLLTGHSCLNKFLYMIGKSNSDSCRFCQLEPESMTHVLLDCEALQAKRLCILQRGLSWETDPKKMTYNDLLKFAKDTKVFETFFRDPNTNQSGQSD